MLNETTSAKRHYFLCRWASLNSQSTPSDKEIMGCFGLASLRMLTKIDREPATGSPNASLCFLCLHEHRNHKEPCGVVASVVPVERPAAQPQSASAGEEIHQQVSVSEGGEGGLSRKILFSSVGNCSFQDLLREARARNPARATCRLTKSFEGLFILIHSL
jgi:hypothetical protein